MDETFIKTASNSAGPYSKKGLTEAIRRIFRGLDFLLLIAFLLWRVFGFRNLRRLSLVEFGPGPTHLFSLKRVLFGSVMFYDSTRYPTSPKSLIIKNLDEGIPLFDSQVHSDSKRKIVATIYFADHCFEHIAANILDDFLRKLPPGLTAFRVPNVESKLGERDFLSDPTHKTGFDSAKVDKMKEAGFFVAHWVRFYDYRAIVAILKSMSVSSAREIIIAGPIRIVR